MAVLQSILKPILTPVLEDIVYNQNYFIFTVKTDNIGTSNNDQFSVPTISGGTYNCTVYWGDGTSDNITTWNDAAWTHTYPADGTYTIRVTGVLTGWKFNNGGDNKKLLNISQWGIFNSGNENAVFYGCNMTVTATDLMDLSGITNFDQFFRNALSGTTVPRIGEWVTSNITSIRTMLAGNSNFNDAGVSDWDTSGVRNMAFCFLSATNFNQDISGWNFEALNNSNNLSAFMQSNTAFNTTNYDALLIEMESQTIISGLDADFGAATFTADAISVTSITRVGTTATVTTDGSHGKSNGEEVAIVGSDQQDYNIPATISNITSTTFDITVAGTPTTPAPSPETILVYRAAAGIARQKLVTNDLMTISDGGAA